MNNRLVDLYKDALRFAYDSTAPNTPSHIVNSVAVGKFAELVVEATLTQVAERAYYTGDRDWSDELDRQWIQLEFGYGPLAELKNEPHTSRSKSS